MISKIDSPLLNSSRYARVCVVWFIGGLTDSHNGPILFSWIASILVSVHTLYHCKCWSGSMHSHMLPGCWERMARRTAHVVAKKSHTNAGKLVVWLEWRGGLGELGWIVGEPGASQRGWQGVAHCVSDWHWMLSFQSKPTCLLCLIRLTSFGSQRAYRR